MNDTIEMLVDQIKTYEMIIKSQLNEMLAMDDANIKDEAERCIDILKSTIEQHKNTIEEIRSQGESDE